MHSGLAAALISALTTKNGNRKGQKENATEPPYVGHWSKVSKADGVGRNRRPVDAVNNRPPLNKSYAKSKYQDNTHGRSFEQEQTVGVFDPGLLVVGSFHIFANVIQTELFCLVVFVDCMHDRSRYPS